MSHRRHHMYHNNYEKDYSFPWYTHEKLQLPDEKLAKFSHQHRWIQLFFPFVGWPLYLYGMPDGCHLYPFPNQRLWKDSPFSDNIKCFISVTVILIYILIVAYFNEFNFVNMLFYYGGSWIILGWWLVTVTYLQHHTPDTLVYPDQHWKFVDAAFETVDRKFGFGIDVLHHHITDCHVVHHLFFTKIPHYHLPLATKALKAYLKENNLSDVYKSESTYDFMFRIYYYLIRYGFLSNIANLTYSLEKEYKPLLSDFHNVKEVVSKKTD
jgi:omega-3 fatty acid desaturase (delta-15 desaturase)